MPNPYRLLAMKCVWSGPPLSKKNCNIIRRIGSKQHIGVNYKFKKYAKWAGIEARDTARFRAGIDRDKLGTKEMPIRVKALVYQGKRQAVDLDGVITTVADVLEKNAKLIKNDYWIVSWDGSDRFRDTDNPRIEVSVYIHG
jgi:Holliday junction resolvase RusA-like endonuclease